MPLYYHTLFRLSSILQTFVWYFLLICNSLAFRLGSVRSGNPIYICFDFHPAPSRTGKYRSKLKLVLFETGRQPKDFRLPPLSCYSARTYPHAIFSAGKRRYLKSPVNTRLSLTARPTLLLLGCRKAEKIKGDNKYEDVGYKAI